jgi:thiamine biosynthesis protein ThiS
MRATSNAERRDASRAECSGTRVEDCQVTIRLNGDPFDLAEPVSVSALLEQLEIDARRVAVERNQFVVKRAAYDSTVVAEGDEIEIVNFVGGG